MVKWSKMKTDELFEWHDNLYYRVSSKLREDERTLLSDLLEIERELALRETGKKLKKVI